MAPTEILARQHYESLTQTLAPFDINIDLLVGSLTKKQKEKVKNVNDFIYKDLANKMKEVMGTKVSIASKGNGKGKIEIEYYSDEELERMFDMIMSIGKEE